MNITRSSTLLLAVAALFVAVGVAPSMAEEPATVDIVFRDADGRTLTHDQIQGVSGTFRYEIVGSAGVPAEAVAMHAQAREAGSRGDYEQAISLLELTADLAPRWPYPVYDMAFTYLLMKDAASSLKFYEKTVELAPRGFFTAITALDALSREKKGELPPGTYMAFLSLDWIDDAQKKSAAARQLTRAVPAFAPGWKELAALTDDDTERLAAIDSGLNAEPDAETHGMLLIDRALVLNKQGSYEQAVEILGALALDPESTVGTEHLAKATLALIAKR